MLTPDITYQSRTCANEFLRSWSASSSNFINEEHKAIFETTSHIDGWQAPHDSFKLYEMGYFCGDTILEIGVYGGRSATVALRGALANPKRQFSPHYFGVDVDLNAVVFSIQNLEAEKLRKSCAIFCGDIKDFNKAIKINPTMVFVDGDHSYGGVKTDIEEITKILSPGTPVLFHDWCRPLSEVDTDIDSITELPSRENVVGSNMWIGVQKACNEWERAGYANFAGAFGCCGLYITTERCTAHPFRTAQHDFDLLSDFSQRSYLHLTLDMYHAHAARS